ncbi:MAG TPA: hypothetical protein VMV07_21335 [Streptosporangiaceae bacterium]|nr:hypothetical protein [Streptosporangiaceae bacterium]
MHLVTDDFLASLERDGDSPAAGDGSSAGITDIWIDRKGPWRFDIEVISDLRIDGALPDPDAGYPVAAARALRAAFVDRYKHLRGAFNVTRTADLMVNCGDLIAGRKDATEAESRRVTSAYADICLPAFRELREADREKRTPDPDRLFPDLLSIPGNEDVYGGGGPVRGPWAPAPSRQGEAEPQPNPYYSHFVGELAANSDPEQKRPESHPVAAVFRIMPRSDPGAAGGLENAPIAYIAVIGFDSNSVQYEHDLAADYGQVSEEQLQWSRDLVSRLRDVAARSTPLYVIAVTHHNLLPVEDRVVYPPGGEDDERVTSFQNLLRGTAGVCDPMSRLCVTRNFLAENARGTTSNASGFLSHCLQLRASLVLHGNMHQRAVTTLVSTPLLAGRPATEVSVLAAPAFAAGRPSSGMARISLDLWKGQAEIAFHYDTALDGGSSDGPIQVIRPLISASRVSSAERRLYAKVCDLVADALKRDAPKRSPQVLAFAAHVAEVWESDGYTPVCMPDGTLPHLGVATRQNRYYLLLLLRETEGGNYEMLLSRHNPLRPSEVAEWDTLLMPAFRNVRDLMERLHLDVVRQVVTQAEDMRRASSARTFDDAVERIQEGGGNLADDIWIDKIRELDTTRTQKISPATGEITDYEYRMVVLTPFVRDRQSVDLDSAVGKQRKQLEAELTVVDWLTELPSVQLRGAPLSGRRTIPLEAIMTGGAGLRWEPAADPDDPDDISEDEARRRTVLPPGAVWFPLPEIDDREGPWTLAPSLLARNADVMRWVEQRLIARRTADGHFPPHIVLGQMKETTGYHLAEGPFPYLQPLGADGSDAGLATSTMEAMNRIEYTGDFDLRKQRPYQGLDVRRVALVRRTIQVRSGRRRDVILVFDATPRDGSRIDLSLFRTCPSDTGNGLLGVLRPAQRYVLEAGLERAGWVNDFLAQHCGDDPWGFLRATFGGAGDPVALTPPVIEQVHPDDWDSDDDSMLEFVVCDGNHRIIRKVWNGGDVAPAIAVVSPPRQPYYARPFSPYEWDITAGNRLTVSPDPRFRYAPRPVDPDKLEITPEAREELRSKPEESLFRRYYRDISTGFGPVGGQGGRYA